MGIPELMAGLFIALSMLALGLATRQRAKSGTVLWATLAAMTFFFGIKDYLPVSQGVPMITNVNPNPTQVDYQANWQQVTALYPNVSAWQYQIETAAQNCGVDPLLVAAVMTQESKGDPNVCSNMGACGLMQLMPGTAQQMNVTNPFDPSQNVTGGSCYLRQMFDRYGQLDIALAAYNAGPGNVDNYGGIPPFAETQKYVRNVTYFYEQYRGASQAAPQMTGQITHPPMRNPRLTKAYGVPVSYQAAGYHTGLDLGIRNDDGIYAVGNGVIVHVGPVYLNQPGKGRGPYSIILQLGEGLYATYGHNKETFVAVGDVVQGGQRIATVGNLGYSYGEHLHFEVCQGCQWTGNWVKPFSPERFVDPLQFYQGGL